MRSSGIATQKTKKIQNNIPLPYATCEQEEKYLSKFSNVALEAKTWCASEDAVDALIQVCVCGGGCFLCKFILACIWVLCLKRVLQAFLCFEIHITATQTHTHTQPCVCMCVYIYTRVII